MANQELTWLVSKFVVETPGVTHALVLSADGIPMASSDRLTQDAYARGYLKPADFDGVAGKMVAMVVKDERITGKACAG